jgi:hypothetical protein
MGVRETTELYLERYCRQQRSLKWEVLEEQVA